MRDIRSIIFIVAVALHTREALQTDPEQLRLAQAVNSSKEAHLVCLSSIGIEYGAKCDADEIEEAEDLLNETLYRWKPGYELDIDRYYSLFCRTHPHISHCVNSTCDCPTCNGTEETVAMKTCEEEWNNISMNIASYNSYLRKIRGQCRYDADLSGQHDSSGERITITFWLVKLMLNFIVVVSACQLLLWPLFEWMTNWSVYL